MVVFAALAAFVLLLCPGEGFMPPATLRRLPSLSSSTVSSSMRGKAALFKGGGVNYASLSRVVLQSTSDEISDGGAELTVEGEGGSAVISTEEAADGGVPPRPWYKDPVGAVKRWFGSAKMDRAQLAALGASALCSYGLISNINYCGSMIAAFVIFAKRNNVSPFGSGMWKEFLTIYGGLWAAMNFLRPVRFWLSVGLTPYFDKIVETIAAKTGVKRPVAFGITVFLVNVCGTLTFLSSGLLLASYFTKVPLIAPKPL